jgi:hypothetical protein
MQADSACRRLVVAIVAMALACSAGSCGSGVDPSTAANKAASIATTHGGTSGNELILPVNAYGYTVPERNRLGWARDILISECMHGFGFEFSAANTTQNDRLTNRETQDFGFYGNKRRYGVTDMAAAARYGYHLASTTTGATSAGNQANPAGTARLSTAERAILVGTGPDGKRMSRSASGRQVPSGGCVGAVDAKLAGSGSVGEAKPVSDLDKSSFEQSLKNAKVTTAFRAWSVCMTGKGYHFAGPLDASGAFDLDTKTVSAHETTTARADVACKQQTHLVDIWFGVEVAYQRPWIEQHAGQCHKAKTDHDTTMKLALKTTSGDH